VEKRGIIGPLRQVADMHSIGRVVRLSRLPVAAGNSSSLGAVGRRRLGQVVGSRLRVVVELRIGLGCSMC
jgi:hypothetical protein